MSLNPSFDQNDCTLDSAAALQALLIVSPDGRIQFATMRADLWMRNLFTAASPVDRLLIGTRIFPKPSVENTTAGRKFRRRNEWRQLKSGRTGELLALLLQDRDRQLNPGPS